MKGQAGARGSASWQTPSIRFAIAALLVSSYALCASSEGALSGTVADPTGAVIPGVAVNLLCTDTGVQRIATTNSDGSYLFPVLPAGHYELEIHHPGFKPYRQVGLSLDATTALRVDAKLELGDQRETLTVSEAGLHVETTTAQMGEAVSGTKIASVPLNGRSFTDLLALQPGIVPTSSQQPNAVVMSGVSSTPPSGDLDPGSLSVSGQRETANGFMVNGSDVEEGVNMGTAIVPNLDSIQELRVLTNNSDAEYGNYSGGQVIVVTKSGGNDLHGDGFEFLRNTKLDARNFFSSDRANFRQNQFGGALGGPLKRDRVFFFGDYQGTRMTQGIDTGLIAIPSFEDRAGDLSDLSSSLTGTVTGSYWAKMLGQELGYPVTVGEPYYRPGCNRSAECVFPNATILQSAWSAPAKALLKYIPQPNQGANYFATSAYDEALRDDKGALRLDSDTRSGTLSAYCSLDDYFLNNPYPTAQGGADVPGFNALSLGRAQLLSLNWTKTLGSNMVNEFHLSYLRFGNQVGQPVGGVGPKLSEQGFVEGPGTLGIVPLEPKIEGIENVALNSFTFGVDTTGLGQVNNLYQVINNLSKAAGKHLLKMGGGLHIDQINVNPDAVYNGSFQFTGSETGSDFADFLLGVASYYRQGDSASFYLRNKYLGLYGQDSWRATPNLTLNYGLRWDVLPPWYEKYNQLQTLVPGQQSVVYPGAPEGLVFPGDPGIPRTLASPRYTNLAPRLGLAYSPSFQDGWLGKIFGGPGKTSLRAGYGMFYTAFEGLSASIMSANPPYGYDYNSSTSPLFATPFVAAATGQSLGQPFPSPIAAYGASATHPDRAVDWLKYEPITGVPSFFPGNVTPYAESHSLSLEREFGPSTIFSLSYVGSEAHHLLVLISADPGNPALCLSVSQPNEVMPGTPTCGPFNEGGIFTRANGQTVQVRGPFNAQFDAVTYQKTIANSSYEALEATLRHNSKSLEVMAGYTYGKSLDDSSSLAEELNPIYPGLSRALSAFDMRHNFIASYRYMLPAARLARRSNRWTEGWSLSGITRFTSGLPVTLFNNNDTSLLGTIPNGINNNGVDTPDFTPGHLLVNTDPRNGKPAFNTSLFSLPRLGTIGTAARRFFYGPGIADIDLALLKDLPFSESKTLQLRLEGFNALNHAQFYGPAAVNGNISSASFGQVVGAAPPRLLQLAVKFYF
jgi:hypothetical protein